MKKWTLFYIKHLIAENSGGLMQKYAKLRDYPFLVMSRHPSVVRNIAWAIIFILYNIYLAFAIQYNVEHKQVLYICKY